MEGGWRQLSIPGPECDTEWVFRNSPSPTPPGLLSLLLLLLSGSSDGSSLHPPKRRGVRGQDIPPAGEEFINLTSLSCAFPELLVNQGGGASPLHYIKSLLRLLCFQF